MIAANTALASEYVLTFPLDDQSIPNAAVGRHASLPDEILRQNIKWFCFLRWIIVSASIMLGIAGLIPGFLASFGLRAYRAWPFVAAGFLALTNLAFLAHARRLSGSTAPARARANLWTQIVLDLLVLTVVVHFMGSLETYAAFAYLFHIVLSCLFFSRGRSFIVTAIAALLFITCVVVEEITGIVPAGIYLDTSLREQLHQMPGVPLQFVVWAVFTWIGVWYLASELSTAVQQRDYRLFETNRRLIVAQEEKAKHMLRTTHELKAPFAAINANVQLLLKGLCGELPAEARDVMGRIANRSRRLAGEIQEMLQLTNLQAIGDDTPTWVELDLAVTIRWCIEQLAPLAQQRGVRLEQTLHPARVRAAEDHMRMLFSNLIANAINYSNTDGTVRIACRASGGSGPVVVTIEDEGIGIAAANLPHVFDEYYRTREAARHNKESSGLGLAIVRNVAEIHEIKLHVKSQPNAGTTFTLEFSRTGSNPAGRDIEEES